ncbi:MAG: VOC family protein [Bacteroidota bacterium]
MTVLEVRDPEASHSFYRRLGFGTLGVWDPGDVGTVIVQRGDVTLMLQKAEAPVPNSSIAAYIYVSDPDAVHAEFHAAGVESISAKVAETHYGCRDFNVTDIDGHNIAFGRDLNPSPYGRGLGPDREAI